MSLRALIAGTLLSVSALYAAPAAWAQDATVDQVYQAAHAGKYTEAQAMMDQVLRAHPNSGKAHYVEAELLAGQGKLSAASGELAKAERLAPGLPFAKPDAVRQLRAQIAGGAKPVGRIDTGVAPVPAPVAAGGGVPWGWIIGLGALAALVVFALSRWRAGKYAQQRYAPAAGPVGGAMAGAPPQYGGVPIGQGVPGTGGGIGSGIAGGLATGAAMGAGLVAGQALMHHFTDRDGAVNDAAGNNPAPGTDPLQTPDPLLGANEMGGEDFGVADPGNWDDGSGGLGSGDEWT